MSTVIPDRKAAPKYSEEQCATIYNVARLAAMKAAALVDVKPMTVLDGTQRHVIADGLCGFAWVIIKPGNSSFARFLKANDLARPDSYYGGVCIWVAEFNQSHTRKVAYANALAVAFRQAGIYATAMERLD